MRLRWSTNKTAVKAVNMKIYNRVTTSKQAEEGYSIEEQFCSLEKYLKKQGDHKSE